MDEAAATRKKAFLEQFQRVTLLTEQVSKLKRKLYKEKAILAMLEQPQDTIHSPEAKG